MSKHKQNSKIKVLQMNIQFQDVFTEQLVMSVAEFVMNIALCVRFLFVAQFDLENGETVCCVVRFMV